MTHPNGTTPTLSPELSHATENLADALWTAPALAAYRQAQTQLEAEPEAQALLQQLATVQDELRLKQSHGQITQADVDALRTLQDEARTNETIMAYIETQQGALAFLPQVNQAISEMLGIDFAALAA